MFAQWNVCTVSTQSVEKSDPSSQALLAGVLDSANASVLVAQIDQRLRKNAPFGARQLEKGYRVSNDDKVGTAENWDSNNRTLMADPGTTPGMMPGTPRAE